MTQSQPGALSNRQIARAAGVVLLGFLASGILGLVRTTIFAAIFGAGAELDAFYTAQQIPELLFTLVAGGALGSSFIPVYARLRKRDDDSDAWRLASAVMSLSALAAAAFGLLLALTAPLYMTLLYPRELYQELAVALAPLLMTTTMIFSISGLLMGILNAHQNFLLPALALSMNNLGLIFGALVLAPLLPTTYGLFAYPDPNPLVAAHLLPNVTQVWDYLSPQTANVYGLALGAVLGALLHLAVQLPGLRTVNARLRPLFNWRIEGVREVLVLMLPRVFGLAVTRINFLVSFFFANLMLPASATVLNTAWFLTFFTLGIIAQSVGTALFPTLSALAANNDIDGYKDRLASAMRSVLFLSFPASVGLIVLGQPVISLLFERGEWTSVHSEATAWALAFYAVGIAGHSLLEVLSRAFYALSDTRTPVLVGVISLVSNIILNVVFIQFIGDPESLARGPFAGLALANSVTTLLEGLALWWLLRRRIGDLNDRYIIEGAGRALVAALVMGATVWALVAFVVLPVWVLAPMGVALGGLVFFGAAFALQLQEARTIPGVILRRFR